MNVVLQIARLVAVVALLCMAAGIATPKGRLPLALRGVLKIMRNDRPQEIAGAAVRSEKVPAWKKFVAFVLVLLAILLCLI